MIELTTDQFLILLGVSGAQLATIAGFGASIFLRLGRVGARLDDHGRRLRILEGKPA
jgi:hypothetical protein